MLVAFIYFILFSTLIFFYFKKKKTHFPIWVFNSVFTLKIIAGFGLTYIYTHQYKDRSTADIFKYYDDAKVMYSSLEKAPKDYFRMITGIGNNTFHFDTCYYEKMNHWYKRNDFGLYNDNHTIIRFNAILMPFTFNSFHAHTVIMCFFSFIGLYFLFSFFNYFLKDKEWLVLCAVFLVPSVLFWGSGVLKEGILLFSIGGLLYSILQLVFRKKITFQNLLLFSLSFLLLLINKVYWLPLLILPICCLIITHYFQFKKPFWFYLVAYLFVGVCFYSFTFFFQKKNSIHQIAERQQSFINLAQGGIYLLNQEYLIRLNPADSNCLQKTNFDSVIVKSGTSYLKWKLNNFEDTIIVKTAEQNWEKYKIIAVQQKAGSLLFEDAILPNINSFLKFIPVAFINASLMPLPWHSKSIMELVASLENLLLMILLLISLFFLKHQKEINHSFLWFLIFVVLSVLFVVGFTTPVSGAIVRYKMPVIPFLMMIAVCFYPKIKNK